MEYLTYCRNIYSALKNFQATNFTLNSLTGYDSFLEALSSDFSGDELRSLFRKEVDQIIETELPQFQTDLEATLRLKEVSFYENSISQYTSFFLVCIWEQRTGLTEEQLKILIRSIFFGTIGYRLIDIHSDEKKFGEEFYMLGFYMIHLHEELLASVFGYEVTMPIVKKFKKLYVNVEYKEKQSRWKTCPFKWDKAYEIGHKTAPLFSIFELIFRSAGFNNEKLTNAINGLIHLCASIQLMDDIADAEEDLSAGIETLVMSGFYNKYGTNRKAQPAEVDEFLDQSRLNQFYDVSQELYNEARGFFTKAGDLTLLLFLEIQNTRFNNDVKVRYI